MASTQRNVRLKRELLLLMSGKDAKTASEDTGSFRIISNGAEDGDEDAKMLGPPSSPYEGGTFVMALRIPSRYPFEPPNVTFVTPVYHPNIDERGQICLDLLKMPPRGGWKPSIGLNALLQSVRLLLSMPNPDDPLMPAIASQFMNDHKAFVQSAQAYTRTHARMSNGGKENAAAGLNIIADSKAAHAMPCTTEHEALQDFCNVIAEKRTGSADGPKKRQKLLLSKKDQKTSVPKSDSSNACGDSADAAVAIETKASEPNVAIRDFAKETALSDSEHSVPIASSAPAASRLLSLKKKRACALPPSL